MNIRELDNLVVYEFLKNFGLSLIGVFIPVYIVSKGFGLLPAALFIVISGIAGVVLSYPISKIISRIGFKHSLVISYIFLILGLLIIRQFKLSLIVIVLSSLLYNFGRLLHNISLNSEFAVKSDKEKRASDSGKMLSLPTISKIIAPITGGFIFATAGFAELMYATVGILLLSIIPLALSKDHRDPMDYNIRKLFTEEYLKTVPLFIIRGIQAVTAVAIFSLFVYTQVGGSVDVGGAKALNSLGFVLTGLLVGRFATRVKNDLFVTVGCIGAATVFFLRGFLVTPLQVFIVSFFGGIFFQIYHVPLYSSFADRAEDTAVLEFYTLRKIFVALGNIITVSIFAVFFMVYDLETAFIANFVFAGLATLSMALMYWKNKELN